MKQQTSPTVAGVPPAFLNRFGMGEERSEISTALRDLHEAAVS